MKTNNWALAGLVVRLQLGILFLMAGWWKVFDLGASEHAQRFFVDAFSESWIPVWLLWPLGVTIPFLELAAGLLLLVGWRIRATVTVLGLLLAVTTYGHALLEPLFDIDGHTFTRLALVVFLLLAPAAGHRYSLDHVIGGEDS